MTLDSPNRPSGPVVLALDSPFPEAAAYYIEETTSTMDEARRLSALSPRGLVRAGFQSGGRGRLPDRTWQAEAGESLLVTLWFPADEFGGAPLPLLTGLALARTCLSWAGAENTAFAAKIRLKWPNDLLFDSGKLAGILCEASGGVIYAGIGVNCAQTAFPPGFRTPPCSLCLATGRVPDQQQLLEGLVRELYRLRGFSPDWKNHYEALLAWRDQRVRFRPGIGGEAFEGILRGVDPGGAVRIERPGDEKSQPVSWVSGELSPVS